MKRIMYSEHAIERTYARRVTDAEVEATIQSPDLREPGRHGRLEAVKSFGKKRVRVVYMDLPNMYLVITAYED